MPTLGEALRQKREERGITLSEISESTKIGTRFLKAIETDNFSVLPGGIFTRSFIRTYAKQVGLDEEEAIALYQQQVTGHESVPIPEISSTTVSPQPEIVEKPFAPRPVVYQNGHSSTNWSSVIIYLGIAVFVVLIGLAVFKRFWETPAEPSPQQANEAVTPAQPDSQPASSQPAASQPTQSGGDTTTPQPPSVPAGEPIRVRVEATTDAVWISYQLDGSKGVAMILKPGQVQEIPPAQQDVVLSYGNRVSLKLMINNREAQFPADAAKFQSKITVNRDNLQTFFP
jgi:cytoskeletal protein RodZ